MSDLAHCLAILKALQIGEVRYSLSGGGDSSTTTLEDVSHSDGRRVALPTVTIGIDDFGEGVVTLDERLESLVADIPDGDWINNEGGYGSVILRPQEPEGDHIECDMTYGDDEGAADFEDDETADFADSDPSDPDADGTLIIDDTTLTKGETP
jgi:hypothetical protein